MRLLMLLAAVVATAGCLDTVLPDPVLPKNLEMHVEYQGGQSELEGIEYSILVADADGNPIIDESGTLEAGSAVDVEAVFETLGPYTVALDLSHPSGQSWSKEVTWDFEIVCRDAGELQVSAIFSGEDIDWQASSDGRLCF